MQDIKRQITLTIKPAQAFQKFVHEFNEWWPPEYTWSQDKLEKIFINAHPGGLCTELGPRGFRCDWGRVSALDEGKRIDFSWQISAKREPIPDPDQTGTIRVEFRANGDTGALVLFEHGDFDKYEADAGNYREMMNSEQGWPYILEKYKSYCER